MRASDLLEDRLTVEEEPVVERRLRRPMEALVRVLVTVQPRERATQEQLMVRQGRP